MLYYQLRKTEPNKDEEESMENETLGIDVLEALVFAMNKYKPNEDGSCRTEGCDGRVVAEVNGLFRGRYTHGTPFCRECKRPYISAVNVPVIGIEEFNESLKQPMTI